MASVQLQQVTKSYDGKHNVIHGIDLDIQHGEFVVLVGPSGCGKSTLLRMIAGLESISGGDVLIDGQRVNEVASWDPSTSWNKTYPLHIEPRIAAGALAPPGSEGVSGLTETGEETESSDASMAGFGWINKSPDGGPCRCSKKHDRTGFAGPLRTASPTGGETLGCNPGRARLSERAGCAVGRTFSLKIRVEPRMDTDKHR